jgi:hypothetical protein
MEIINLRHQVVVFGNFDDITPNMDNIKYFIEVFADKNLIPSQFKEISLNLTGNTVKNNDLARLSLTSINGMWNIRFNVDRIDFVLTNSNIGRVEMPNTESFLAEVEDILTKVSQKFPKTYKRVGLVSQYLFKDIDAKQSSQKANKAINFFDEKPIVEWSNKTTTRTTVQIPEAEIINISNELRWIKTNIKINDRNGLFDGLLLNIDINTINENQNYRFNSKNLKILLKEISQISETLKNENVTILN